MEKIYLYLTIYLLRVNHTMNHTMNQCVDRLGKLPLKEQQLSRTQHFILSSHAALFVSHTQYGPCGIPLTPMIRGHDYLLSTNSSFLFQNAILSLSLACNLFDETSFVVLFRTMTHLSGTSFPKKNNLSVTLNAITKRNFEYNYG